MDVGDQQFQPYRKIPPKYLQDLSPHLVVLTMTELMKLVFFSIYTALIRKGEVRKPRVVERRSEELISITYTSGSTGIPKVSSYLDVINILRRVAWCARLSNFRNWFMDEALPMQLLNCHLGLLLMERSMALVFRLSGAAVGSESTLAYVSFANSILNSRICQPCWKTRRS